MPNTKNHPSTRTTILFGATAGLAIVAFATMQIDEGTSSPSGAHPLVAAAATPAWGDAKDHPNYGAATPAWGDAKDHANFGAETPAPPPVESTLLARGTANRFHVRNPDMKLTLDAKRPTDLAFVKATIIPRGQTGWHAHPGPSLVVIKGGSLTLRSSHGARCHEQTHGAGTVFEHPQGVHNFIAGDQGVEFYVAYFVPAGTTALLTTAPVPTQCS